MRNTLLAYLMRSFVISARVEFTGPDFENLSAYLAAKTPYEEHGGRSGKNVYTQLLEQVPLEALFFRFVLTRNQANVEATKHWAMRHTWQSWRENYINNKAKYDKRIAHLVSKRIWTHDILKGRMPFRRGASKVWEEDQGEREHGLYPHSACNFCALAYRVAERADQEDAGWQEGE